MREIKFRMWNPCRNDGNGGYHYGKQAMDCLTQQSIGLYDHVKDGSAFEQFTGLRDKYGKEVCEGDIITVEGLQYVFDDITKADSLKDYCFSKKVEIIGNIHENKELLDAN